MRSTLVTAYLRWTFTRAALWRGYWIVTALYLVVVARLSPFQLILLGVFQGLTVLVVEVPAGLLADAVSRRGVLVVAHVATGAGMAMAGLVRSFPLLAVSQCCCGLGWALANGADVAWLTDEVSAPGLVDRALVAQGRWALLGDATGTAVFGMLAWATTLSSAIVTSGIAMVLLGAVVLRWPETRRPRRPSARVSTELTLVLRRGVTLARADRVILVLIAATALVNGGGEVLGRLREVRLVALGLPARPAPIVWFAALNVVAVALGAAALRVVEARVHREPAARPAYALAGAAGALGIVCFAFAPDARTAAVGVLLAVGVASPVMRTVTSICANRRATSDVRATVHSFVSQAEHAGEIVFGVSLALVARTMSTTVALVVSACLLAAAGVLVSRTRDMGRAAPRLRPSNPRAPEAR